MHFNVIAPNLLLLVFPLPWNGKSLFQVITMIMISSFLKLKLSFGKKKGFFTNANWRDLRENIFLLSKIVLSGSVPFPAHIGWPTHYCLAIYGKVDDDDDDDDHNCLAIWESC